MLQSFRLHVFGRLIGERAWGRCLDGGSHRVGYFSTTHLGASSVSSESPAPQQDSHDALQDGLAGTEAAAPITGLSVQMQEALRNADLSTSAVVSILKGAAHGGTVPHSTPAIIHRVQELQKYFGKDLASRLLSSEPQLLQRAPSSIQKNFKGLQEVFNLPEEVARVVVRKCPMLLGHPPISLKRRHDAVQLMFEATDQDMAKVLLKMPHILRTSVKRVGENIPVLCEATGLPPRRLLHVCYSWPILPTMKKDTLVSRIKSVGELLGADKQELQRILSSWPNLLARDQTLMKRNMAAIAAELDLAQEDVRKAFKREPGLFSYNLVTLIAKIRKLCEVLQLPRKLQLTLLTYNRPLLTAAVDCEKRVDAVRKLLKVPDDQLFPIIHGCITIMRFPAQHIHAKVTSAAAIAATDPLWKQQWEAASLQRILRVIQSSWACLWRPVYLKATGQAHSNTFVNAVICQRASFLKAYPDYEEWLQRYNDATGSIAISSAGPIQRNEGLTNKPNMYQPIVTDIMGGKGYHAGSLYNQEKRAKNREGALAAAAAAEGTTEVDEEGIDDALGSTSTSSTTPTAATPSSYLDALADITVEPYRRGRHVRAEPAAILAAWMGLPQESVEEALARCPELLGMSWNTWKIKIRAAEEVLVGLGWMDLADCSVTSSSRSTTSYGVVEQGSSSSSSSGSMGLAVEASSSSSSDDEDDWGSSSSSSSDEEGEEAGENLLGSLTALQGHSSSSSQPSSSSSGSGQAAGAHSPMPLPVKGKVLHPVALARKRVKHALQYADRSGLDYELPGAAVAAAAVCLNLASFSPGLWDIPPKMHPCTAQLILAHPKGFTNKSYALKCHGFLELFKVFPAMKEEVAFFSVAQLAKLLSCPLPRLQLLSFFIGNSKYPYPWDVSLRSILTHSDGKKFLIKAYPEFDSWAEAKGFNSLRETRRRKKAEATGEAEVAEAAD